MIKAKLSKSVILCICIIQFSQITSIPAQAMEKESLIYIENEAIKKEISSFHKAFGTGGNIKSENVKEVPMKICNENLIYFDVRNIISTNLIVSIESKQNNVSNDFKNQTSKAEISLRVVIGPHVTVNIPDSAYKGIYKPSFCKVNNDKKKYNSCRVYRSFDKRRLYVCMIYGDDGNRNEIIWIIEGTRYFGRVVYKVKE